MRPSKSDFFDGERLIFPEIMLNRDSKDLAVKTITFQVTEDCSLRCSYCYQGCKRPNYMTFDVAKAFIDNLFENRLDPSAAINELNDRCLIIEFIGGEPFLAIELIEQISDYFEQKLLDNPSSIWLLHHRYSLCSNGVAYFDERVQRYLHKYRGFVSVNITIDGCKELHDSCRLFPDGSPSYDIAIKAALAELAKGNDSTKVTLSPDNISYTAKGVINMLELGFRDIMINPVYEEGWTVEHAKITYEELKKVADYIVEHDLQNDVYIRLFDPENYHNKYLDGDEEGNRNWCGSTSCMYAIDYQGKIYPCLRFMASSLNGEAEPYDVGDIENGIGNTELHRERLDDLYGLTKAEQSTDECLNCPIECGCSWCTGYNYQHFGTFKRRATYICYQHKAAALASLYFFKLCKDRKNYEKINVTESLALEIISESEWDRLKWKEEDI